MHKRIFLLLLIIMALLFCACGKASDAEFTYLEYSFEGVEFRYGGESYDLTEQVEVINSITNISEATDKLVIECHVGPQNSAYCIFDAESTTFERILIGNNLVWHDGDITTSLYSYWSDIFDYDGNVIKSYGLGEDEFIYSLEFSEDNTELTVTISGGESDRTDLVKLQ